MKQYIASIIACLVVCLICVASAAPPKNRPSDEELVFLAKLLAPLKQLANEAGGLESAVENAADSKNLVAPDMAKRQGAWDMDYGWGGGRFGKRNMAKNNIKRYDAYGIAGRFGRDVDHVDADGH